MKRASSWIVLAAGIALVMVGSRLVPSTSPANGQPAKPSPRWQYASLSVGDAAADVYWGAGKTVLHALGDVTNPNLDVSATEVYRKLGGTEKSANLGVLLDQIGQQGWELVACTRSGAGQTWTFKRPRP